MEQSTKIARSIPFAFLGIGFARAWVQLLYANPVIPIPTIGLSSHMIFDLGYVALALVVFACAKRIIPFSECRATRFLAPFCMIVSTILAIALPAFGEAAPAVGAIASCIGGIGFIALSFMNVEIYAPLSSLRILLYLSAAYVLGGLLAFLSKGMAAEQLNVMLILLPLIAFGCIRSAYAGLAASERPRRTIPPFSFPWKIIALIAVYSFAYGLRQAQLVGGAGRGSSLATMLAMAVVFLGVYFFADRIVMARFYKAPMLFMICGLLLIPAQTLIGEVASSYLISISYTLMHILILLLLYDMSNRAGIPIIVLAAPFYASQVFAVFGQLTSEALTAAALPAAAQSTALTIAIAVLIAVVSIIALSEKELGSRWKQNPQRKALGAEGTEAERLTDRCNELSQAARLSAREDEVMRLLARKKTMATISRDLFIAEGTVKAHVRHIYEKLGIHTRQELFDLLGIVEGE